jgi:hypothetical protein
VYFRTLKFYKFRHTTLPITVEIVQEDKFESETVASYTMGETDDKQALRASDMVEHASVYV